MDYITILAIALGLSFDTFAVSLSYGVIQNKILIRQASGIAFIFAVFQGGMTVTGYFMGTIFSDILKQQIIGLPLHYYLSREPKW